MYGSFTTDKVPTCQDHNQYSKMIAQMRSGYGGAPYDDNLDISVTAPVTMFTSGNVWQRSVTPRVTTTAGDEEGDEDDMHWVHSMAKEDRDRIVNTAAKEG